MITDGSRPMHQCTRFARTPSDSGTETGLRESAGNSAQKSTVHDEQRRPAGERRLSRLLRGGAIVTGASVRVAPHHPAIVGVGAALGSRISDAASRAKSRSGTARISTLPYTISIGAIATRLSSSSGTKPAKDPQAKIASSAARIAWNQPRTPSEHRLREERLDSSSCQSPLPETWESGCRVRRMAHRSFAPMWLSNDALMSLTPRRNAHDPWGCRLAILVAFGRSHAARAGPMEPSRCDLPESHSAMLLGMIQVLCGKSC